MGLLDKVKNLFTEEVDEPEEKVVKKEIKPVKKEEIKKEIFKQERTVEIAPARKETADFFEKELSEEPKIEKVKEKPSSILFEDDAFSDLPTRHVEKPKNVTRSFYNEVKEERYKPKKVETIKVEEKKSFKPSPIISPVYGILDKNYKKEDIPSKVTPNPYKNEKITVDDVRNKAFGTLEDDLENTLISKALIINNESVDSGIDIFEELETKSSETIISEELEKQKKQIEEINEIIKTNVSSDNKKITSRKIDNILEELDEIEELIPNKNEEEENVQTIDEVTYKHTEENTDELEEGDLFNLIDSMYEKRDE